MPVKTLLPAHPGFQINSALFAEFARVIGRVPCVYGRALYRECRGLGFGKTSLGLLLDFGDTAEVETARGLPLELDCAISGSF